MSLARLWRDQGKREEARELLDARAELRLGAVTLTEVKSAPLRSRVRLRLPRIPTPILRDRSHMSLRVF